MVTYVGYRHVDYVNKSGKKVEGYILYFTEKRDGVVGVSAFDAWVSGDVYLNYFIDLALGSELELSYNRYGGLSGCIECN